VRQVHQKFDEHNIPMDVIWLDIEHTDSKKYFTWDKHNFPNPVQMQNSLARKGRKLVTIVDPHVKRVSGYDVYDQAVANNYFIKKAGGDGDYEGHCWPGSSSWVDYLNPNARNWYSSLFSFEHYVGSTKNLYTWIDMNEPSVFSGPEITLDKSVVHYGGLENRDVHNMYSFLHVMTVYDGHLKRDPNDRPFILTRSFFAGSQRFAAHWTGDNQAQFTHLDKATPMLLSLGLAGYAFVGADVGGFFDDPKEELLVRWYQAGAFYPFFRQHAEIQTKRREPWLFTQNALRIIRNSIRRRYALLPYLYTLFHEASISGLPVMRPLFLEYPNDQNTYSMGNQFLVGSDLLVKPIVMEKESSTSVYLPSWSFWYDFGTGMKYQGHSSLTFPISLEDIPVFQRGGSIIAMKKRVRRSTSQMGMDPYTLQIALSRKGNAAGQLYVDDGKSFAYLQKKEFTIRRFVYNTTMRNEAILENVEKGDSVTSGFLMTNSIERIVIYGMDVSPKELLVIVADQKKQGNSISATSPNAPSSVMSTVAGDGGIILNSIGGIPLKTFDYNRKLQILTIHKPNLPIFTFWKLIIKF